MRLKPRRKLISTLISWSVNHILSHYFLISFILFLLNLIITILNLVVIIVYYWTRRSFEFNSLPYNHARKKKWMYIPNESCHLSPKMLMVTIAKKNEWRLGLLVQPKTRPANNNKKPLMPRLIVQIHGWSPIFRIP